MPLASFGEAKLLEDRPFDSPIDRAEKPLDMRSEYLASYPPFYFQNGGRRIKTKHVIVMAVMPLPSL